MGGEEEGDDEEVHGTVSPVRLCVQCTVYSAGHRYVYRTGPTQTGVRTKDTHWKLVLPMQW